MLIITTYLLALVILGSGARAATSGSFSVLSVNVAGLPELFSSGDPEANTALLGADLAPYDIVNAQEDFNYHATLYANDNHPYRTATSGGAAIGSGLNTLSNYNWRDFERVKWNDCSTYDGADCLTPKGFTFMRGRLDDGVYVDLYNLHTDAGTTDADEVARASNINQVLSYISTNSVGNAVIVFGDTNSRWTRTADVPRNFITAGFLEAWIQLIRGGSYPAIGSDALVCPFPFPGGVTDNTCETVDKIFYRSSSVATVTPTLWSNENSKFLNSSGLPLSDHYPITTKFSWSSSASFRQSDLFGGPHGTWFSDLPTLSSASTHAVASITLRGGDRVDAVSLTLSSGTTFTHGGTGGTAVSLTLASGEKLTSVTLAEGQKDGDTRIFYANFVTSTGRTISAGKTTSDTVTYTAPSGFYIVGFLGRSGDEVDTLGLLYAKA